jgi:hypothetical protein
MNNADKRWASILVQTKAQDAQLCHSQQAACNAGMCQKRPQPEGLLRQTSS